jgi:hypothetical protein
MPGSVEVDQVGRNPLAGATGGTWRVAGSASVDDELPFGWSLVVKRIIRVAEVVGELARRENRLEAEPGDRSVSMH